MELGTKLFRYSAFDYYDIFLVLHCLVLRLHVVVVLKLSKIAFAYISLLQILNTFNMGP